MRRQLLDLAAHIGQLGLDLEHVGDLRGALGDPLEGDFARLQVRDPGLQVDDLAGHLDGLGVLGDDLRGQAVEAAQQVEGILPVVGGDAIGDLGGRLVAVVGRVRGADVAAQRDDPVACGPQRLRDVADPQIDRTGADDLGVVAGADGSDARGRVAVLALRHRRGRAGYRGACGGESGPTDGLSDGGLGLAGACGAPRAGQDDHGKDSDRDEETDGAHLVGPPWARYDRTVARHRGDAGPGVPVPRSTLAPWYSGFPFQPPLEPMLAKAVDDLPSDDGWLFEPKWDGFRALVFRDGDAVYTQSRDLKPLDRYFPELAAPLRAALPQRCVLDGEVVISRDGTLDFEALLLRIHPAESRVRMLADASPASFVAWDLLALDDEDLRDVPQGERRARLEGLLGAAEPPVHLTPATRDRATRGRLVRRFEGAGLDGVIAKRLDGHYQPGKRAMLKIKHQRTADCVVAGFRWHKNGPGTHIGSLLLGLFDEDGTLHHVGITSSFTWDRRAALVEELAPLREHALDDHPWSGWAEWAAEQEAGGQRVPGATSRWNRGKDLSWEPLRAERVAEVAYDHLQGSRFRHATTFKRWRPGQATRGLPLRPARGDRPVRAGQDLRQRRLTVRSGCSRDDRSADLRRGSGVAAAGRSTNVKRCRPASNGTGPPSESVDADAPTRIAAGASRGDQLEAGISEPAPYLDREVRRPAVPSSQTTSRRARRTPATHAPCPRCPRR